MKAETKLLKLVEKVNEAKENKRKAEDDIKKAEEAIIRIMGDVPKTSVEKNGVAYTITIGDNVRYALVEEGKLKMINDVPFESNLWKKTPDIGECLNNEEMKGFVIQKEFTPKVIIKSSKVN